MLIAVTGNASPRRGHTWAEVTEMMALWDDFLDGGATPKKVDRLMEILDSAAPVTATMRAQAKHVSLSGIAKVTADFWRAKRAKQRATAKKRTAPQTYIDIAPGTGRNRRT